MTVSGDNCQENVYHRTINPLIPILLCLKKIIHETTWYVVNGPTVATAIGCIEY